MRKKSLMRALMISAAGLAVALAAPASAETLPEAMASAVDGNPSLAAQRSRLAASREALPQAWAEALPSVSLSAGAGIDEGYPTPGVGRSESWSGSANASQLLFASGRIMATTRAARAEIRGRGRRLRSRAAEFAARCRRRLRRRASATGGGGRARDGGFEPLASV